MRGDLSEFAFSSAGHFSFSLLDRKTRRLPRRWDDARLLAAGLTANSMKQNGEKVKGLKSASVPILSLGSFAKQNST